MLQRNVRVLYEAIEPDDFLREYIADYTWLTKLHMLYRKKFYPREHFEVSEEDGAKTRALIREFVDVKALEDDFPTYVLDENYLTKIKHVEPDAKALDIEAMLDAEIRIRLDEDDDVRPLSERLQRIIEDKRAGSLAGIALLNELEELAGEVVEIVEEEKRPVSETIAREAGKRLPDADEAEARAVADAIVKRARELCFPGWIAHEHMETELYRELTVVLATNFRTLGLHGPGSDFVERCIRILTRARFGNEAP